MVRRDKGAMNVTVRKGLIEIIEEEIVSTGYLYTSHAEVIHDAGRLLIFLVLLHKILTGESIKSDKLASFIATLRKKGEGMV